MRSLAFFAGVFALVACRSTTPSVRSTPERAAESAVVDAEVARVLDDWHDAAAKADEERYFAHFADGAIFLGTDATERWTMPQFRAYAHPHFAKGKAWTMRATRREITFAWSPRPGIATAWFDEDLESMSLARPEEAACSFATRRAVPGKLRNIAFRFRSRTSAGSW